MDGPGSSKFQNLKIQRKKYFPLFTSSSSNIFPDSDFDDNKKTCSAFKR